ncbi:MAG TPA: glycosyltransferase family 4 protein, partial [Gemmatimonadaceae bacterium]|nr:glycosyltransferase family 4 protein [Gemmatimonadaceae bacterium]
MSGKPCTILFVHGADEWYGSDYVLYEAVRALKGTEFDAMVLVPDDVTSELPAAMRLSGRLRALGVPVRSVPLTVLRRRYMTPNGIARLLGSGRSSLRAALDAIGDRHIAMVHSHTATVLTGARVARALHVPHLWHVSEIVERPRAVRAWLSRKVVRSADRVVTVSNAVRDHILETQPAAGSKVSVVYNCIDAARFTESSCTGRRRTGPDDRPLIVGMIGRVGTWKGQELLIAAARTVCSVVPNARFVLAGGVLEGNLAALDNLRSLASAYGISDRVTIQEYCTDTPALLRSFDVFVQPSLRPDPLPTTILEAMASGLPVVATDHGGAPEMVSNGVNGLLSIPGDADAMARAIISLLHDPEARMNMGKAGYDRVLRD